MLLAGAIEACALYQGVRAVFAFRAARTAHDVGGANLRALGAIAFGALGAGLALRYVGVALCVVLSVAYGARMLTANRLPEPGGANPGEAANLTGRL